MGGVVWISEDTEATEDGEYLTGRFYGHLDTGELADEFEDLALEEAVAWGRARSDRVLIRIGYGRHVPVDEAELVAPGRRRVPNEAWKDRTEADPPITWAATVMLTPPDPDAPRAELEAEVADAAGSARWDATQLDDWLRERDEAVRRFRAGGSAFAYAFSPCFRVHLSVHAPTHDTAVAAAHSRLTAPEEWRMSVFAEPA